MRQVLIVEGSDIFRRSLRMILSASAEWTICGEAESAEQGARLASRLAPDAIVMDFSMPGISGAEAVRLIHHECPKSKVVIASLHDSRHLVGSILAAGASGYVLKTMADPDLVQALDAAVRGEIYVSPAVAKAQATHA